MTTNYREAITMIQDALDCEELQGIEDPDTYMYEMGSLLGQAVRPVFLDLAEMEEDVEPLMKSLIDGFQRGL